MAFLKSHRSPSRSPHRCSEQFSAALAPATHAGTA
eukprot:CAMPEP_0194353608 /NCGR_PEP_ID=MMETSP0174-20130528/1919_1 /TAXON_ID=216777 /ORGANISM="Proboscia alata, Strain PI-D3" /LENGTH=34 /DNA_ID= /DNA_START= /DNA_END= /DNA_ORIENTATION=